MHAHSRSDGSKPLLVRGRTVLRFLHACTRHLCIEDRGWLGAAQLHVALHSQRACAVRLADQQGRNTAETLGHAHGLLTRPHVSRAAATAGSSWMGNTEGWVSPSPAAPCPRKRRTCASIHRAADGQKARLANLRAPLSCMRASPPGFRRRRRIRSPSFYRHRR